MKVRLARGSAPIALLGALFASFESAQAQSTEDRVTALEEQMKQLTGDNAFKAFWKDSFRLETMDGSTKLRFGGRMHFDTVLPLEDSGIQDNIGRQEDSLLLRRARMYVSGTFSKFFGFKAQYDFAGGDADFKDVFLSTNKVPVVGTIKAGQFKEPVGLEQLTSSNDISFMERSLPDVFTPSRSTGLMVQNTWCRGTWAVGVFKDSDDDGDHTGDGEWALTGRITSLLLNNPDDNQLVHAGISYRIASPNDSSVRFRQRPEARTSDRFVDTGTLAMIDDVHSGGVEVAGVSGPFSVQAEYLHADADAKTGGMDFKGSGGYVYGSYMITGESRRYDEANGRFKNPKPQSPFRSDEGNGMGAWELLARYSMLDLDDGPVTGGEIDDLTIGLNWYMTPNTRIMWNYVHADVDQATWNGDADIFSMRIQWYF